MTVCVCRVIFFVLEILQRYFRFVLEQLDMQDYFFLIVHLALCFQEFKYAELAYHFCFETAFKRNEELINLLRKRAMSVWRENCAKWWVFLKQNLVALCHMLSRFLPLSVQTFTEPFFTALLAQYETAYNQSRAMESATEFSDSPHPDQTAQDAA